MNACLFLVASGCIALSCYAAACAEMHKYGSHLAGAPVVLWIRAPPKPLRKTERLIGPAAR